MTIRVLRPEDKAAYRDEMRAMMEKSDREFVPPLSFRASTVQKDLAGGTPGDVGPYFGEMMKQEIIAAFDGNDLLGYLSYKKDYVNDVIGKESLPNLYLSTLISKQEARGRGLGAALFLELMQVIYPDRNVFTRTWSTNAVQIHILGKLGFHEIHRVKDGRGPGIDTVYYRA